MNVEIDVALLKDRLEELSDRAMQEVLWGARVPGEMSTYDEAVCGVFDDSRVCLAIEFGQLEKTFSQEICAKIHELRAAVHRVPNDADDMKIIAHPRMDDVRKLASELLALLG